jgi:catalase
MPTSQSSAAFTGVVLAASGFPTAATSTNGSRAIASLSRSPMSASSASKAASSVPPSSLVMSAPVLSFTQSSVRWAIGPSPDPMLQARLFAYGDAHRYRLGINHSRLPVNAPQGVAGGAHNYGRDGAMRFDDNGGRTKNYEPNSYDGPAQSGAAYDLGYDVSGSVGPHGLIKHRDDDDYVQAGALYRVMKEDARQRPTSPRASRR